MKKRQFAGIPFWYLLLAFLIIGIIAAGIYFYISLTKINSPDLFEGNNATDNGEVISGNKNITGTSKYH